ncbi:dihydroorotase [Prochlorococcus sp. MIT 1307]|uniref:dihydroorotase n=1 Tax=Prochlorococcus sp. MIT 1307 TaxID=3096219 RepID=UPI002A749789|nr:dihydroorotase [Prochlorococcus sp. MIT 1307]
MDFSNEKITLVQPDDWHLHLRDGHILNAVLASTARVFRRAIIMPNLLPPVTTVEAAIKYRRRILAAIPEGISFTPLMTIYLTDDLSPDVIELGHKEGVFFGAKLYPANSTTNSADGVTDLQAITPLLETMERIGLPLLIHGEVTDPDVDIFDREAIFIEQKLIPLLSRHSSLKVVLEHITTEQAVQFVETCSSNLAATITPHHLHFNRNAMFDGGLRSDFYCLPVAKRERHRIALRKAATSGKSCFFLGTDSAPHLRSYKESSCGCAGIFNASVALESYAEVFDEEGVLDRLEAFSSIFGPDFYGLPINKNSITLEKRPRVVPDFLEVRKADNSVEKILQFHAGETLNWSIASN